MGAWPNGPNGTRTSAAQLAGVQYSRNIDGGHVRLSNSASAQPRRHHQLNCLPRCNNHTNHDLEFKYILTSDISFLAYATAPSRTSSSAKTSSISRLFLAGWSFSNFGGISDIELL